MAEAVRERKLRWFSRRSRRTCSWRMSSLRECRRVPSAQEYWKAAVGICDRRCSRTEADRGRDLRVEFTL